MASSRAPLASHSLEDMHVALISSRNASMPPAQSEPYETASNETNMKDLPSFNKRPKSRLVPFPLRLFLDQIEALEKLKKERDIVPAELIRDAIDVVLQRIKEEGAQ